MANNETPDGLTPGREPSSRRGKGGGEGAPPRAARSDDAHPERTCILTRTGGERAALIRLALSPDGQVAVDVRARAPGRGAWIGVDRPTLETALAKGKLRGALLRAFKTKQVDVPADLAERIGQALARDALDRLGLEARGGTLVTGASRIDEAARAGRVEALLHASDAGADGRRKLDQAWRVGREEEGLGRQGVVIPCDRTTLSLALGRENVVSIAVIDRLAAARVLRAIGRWRRFIGLDPGAGPSDIVAGDFAAGPEFD